MARYTGPKARVNRRLGGVFYEDSGAIRAAERRESPPGMHTRPRRPSNYGLGLAEKQKIKHYYGLGERQLRRMYRKAARMKGNTGEQLLILCERRLDNVIRRSGLTLTRPQARQGVAHGHFTVNGVKVSAPSYALRAGDVIQVRDRSNLKNIYKEAVGANSSEPLDWASVDEGGLQISVQGIPTGADISLPVDINMVVEFLSR